jgi:hypothetical protein
MVDTKQIAVRMSAEDLGILHDIQSVLGVRSQSEIVRMALRALAKEHDVDSRALRATGDRIKRGRL